MESVIQSSAPTRKNTMGIASLAVLPEAHMLPSSMADHSIPRRLVFIAETSADIQYQRGRTLDGRLS